MITDVSKNQDIALVKLDGVLDVSKQKLFKEKLVGVSDEHGNDVVLDFKAVSFIDSSCLGVLVSHARKLREKKGDLKITNLAPDVRSIFQITRLDKVFEIFETPELAVNSFYR